LSTGAVRCWGYANNGQLGYGNNHDVGAYPTMLPVTAGDINVGGKVIQIVAGRNHTCALLDMGAVRCWGRGSGGQLGYGNVDHVGDDESPASTGEFSVAGNVIQIAAGGDHTCALFYTGAVRCWGNNDYGMLGYSHTYTIGDNEIPFEDVPYQ
jgi:alpha-tubulin suppressor-like RCC1 family protein